MFPRIKLSRLSVKSLLPALILLTPSWLHSIQDFRYSSFGKVRFSTPYLSSTEFPYREQGKVDVMQPQIFYNIGALDDRTDGPWGGLESTDLWWRWFLTPDNNVTLSDFGGEVAWCLADVGTLGVTSLFHERSFLRRLARRTVKATEAVAGTVANVAKDATNVVVDNVTAAAVGASKVVSAGADKLTEGAEILGNAVKTGAEVVGRELSQAGEKVVEIGGKVYKTGDRLVSGVWDITYKDVIMDGVVQFAGNIGGCIADLAGLNSCEITDLINPEAVLNHVGTIIKDAAGTVVAVVVDAILVVVPESCQDAAGYIPSELLRQGFGITGDKRSKKNVLAARFKADTTSSLTYVVDDDPNGKMNPTGDRKAYYLHQMMKLRNAGLRKPDFYPRNPVFEIANEPNAFPYLPPHLYAWYYSMWYNYLKDIEAHQTEIAGSSGLTASAFYNPSDSLTVDVMPGGIFTWFGYPDAVLDFAQMAGIRNRDESSWYHQFIGTLGSYGRAEEMVSRANFHFYPYTFGAFGKPFDKHFEHLSQILSYANQHSKQGETWLTEVGNILNPLNPTATAQWMEQLFSGLEDLSNGGAIKRWFWFTSFGRDKKLESLDGSSRIYSGIYKNPAMLAIFQQLFPGIASSANNIRQPCDANTRDEWIDCVADKAVESLTLNENVALVPINYTAGMLLELVRFFQDIVREFVLWDSLNELMAEWARNPGTQNLSDASAPNPSGVEPNVKGKVFGHFSDKHYFFQEADRSEVQLTNATVTANPAAWGGSFVQFNSSSRGVARWNATLPHQGRWRVWVRVRDDQGNNHANDHFFRDKYRIKVSNTATPVLLETSSLTFRNATKFAPDYSVAGSNLIWAYADFSSGFSTDPLAHTFELSSQSEGTFDYALLTNDFGLVPDPDGPYRSFNQRPPLPKTTGASFYAEDFSFLPDCDCADDLNSRGFFDISNWVLNTEARVMQSVPSSTSVSVNAPTFPSVNRDAGIITFEYWVLLPTESTGNPDWSQENKVSVGLVDYQANGHPVQEGYEVVFTPKTQSSPIDANDLELYAVESDGSRTLVHEASTATVAPHGEAAEWIRFHVELHPTSAAGGHGQIRISVDFGDGAGMKPVASVVDQRHTRFNQTYFRQGPISGGVGSSYVQIDNIKVTAEQSRPFVPRPPSPYGHLTVQGKVECANCTELGILPFFPQDNMPGRKWYPLNADGSFAFTYVYHKQNETVHEIKLANKSVFDSLISNFGSLPTLFTLSGFTVNGALACIGTGGDCRSFGFNLNSPLQTLSNIGLQISGSTYVWNRLPVVGISSPADGAILRTGSRIPIRAVATDLDGSIAKVDFFVDGNRVGEDVSAPFNFSWQVPAGAHTLNAVATDNGGLANSSQTVRVSAGAAPVIKVQPQSVQVLLGGSASFTVLAEGNPAPTFTWRKNGVVLSGFSNNVLPIPAAALTDVARYNVTVSNNQGSVTSRTVTLSIVQPSPPVIHKQPLSQSVAVGGTATFRVEAKGFPLLSYQWMKGGVEIPGAVLPLFRIENVSFADSGKYSVLAGNSLGTVLSKPAFLKVSAVNVAERIFGFENPRDWFACNAVLTRNTEQKTQGEASLRVDPHGRAMVTLTSVKFKTSDLSGVTQNIQLDLFVPFKRHRHSWENGGDPKPATLKMFVSFPSAHIKNAFVGEAALRDLVEGRFNAVPFILPESVVAAFQNSLNDCVITFVLRPDHRAGGWSLDNLHFIPEAGGAVLASE